VRLLDLKIGDRVYLPTKYRPEPIPSIAVLRWRVLITGPGREKTTRDKLVDLELGLKPYLPLEHKQVAAGRRRKRDVELPIFKSYIFLPMPEIDEIWHEVLATPGVQGFLSSATRLPKMLTPSEIDRIRFQERNLDAKRLQRLAMAGKHPMALRAQVWVTDLLPFQALLGRVKGYDERGRAEVVLQEAVLGRKVFAIEPHRLKPTDE
jgi:transcription antitermination factor NusG